MGANLWTDRELTAKQVQHILRQLLPHRALHLSNLTAIKNLGLRPQGSRAKHGQQYRFSDLVATAYLFVMKDLEHRMEDRLETALQIQQMTAISKSFVTNGEIGLLFWQHKTRQLASQLLSLIERDCHATKNESR